MTQVSYVWPDIAVSLMDPCITKQHTVAAYANQLNG